MIRRHPVTVTTDGSGVVTAYSPKLNGKIVSIQYVKDGSNAYTDGVDFAITSEKTGEQIWTESNVNASKVCYPRAALHSNAGVAALYAAGGVAVLGQIGLGNDRVKITLAQGGANKVGVFHVVVES